MISTTSDTWNDNRGASFTLNYRRVNRVQCFAPGDNEIESSSIPFLENTSLAPLITRGTKWMLFFLSIAISERKRQNNQRKIKRGPNLIIAVYSPNQKSERIHAHNSHLKHRPSLKVKARHPREHLFSRKNLKMQFTVLNIFQYSFCFTLTLKKC